MITLLRFDGACKGNPGPSSSAFVLFAASNGSSVLAEGLTKHPTSLTKELTATERNQNGFGSTGV